jgi:UDP-N-acetylmuramoyl-L-alanyl-D-glutamate--2,6-diaminopimelate ligase
VTGTNGKTSVSQWIAQALGASGTPCGVIGTLGSGLPGTLSSDALNTTPDALSLQARLAGFVNEGISACAIEASSIGIEQGRLNAARVAVAVFTNLTRDHLDYHGTMERYAAAKARLFSWEGLQAAVINAEDALGQELLGSVAPPVRRIAYALHPVAVPAGTELLVPSSLDFSGSGLRFALKGVDFRVPVVGRFNLANLLAVIGALQCRGMALEAIAAAAACLQPPPGRMQAVGGDGEPLLVVDYAHTPDALGQVLDTLRAAATARGGALVCVFGCGGDRDPGKRPLMGAIAQKRADRVWITSDNPRSEEPQRIADDILSGVVAGNAVHLCLDRAEAIRRATLEAGPEDVIVLAGKGHEPYQEIAGVRQPFSDLEQAKSALVIRRLAVSHAEQTA